MWKNIAEPGRPHMTRLRIACWTAKGTNTQSGYVILLAFPLQPWLHERASVLSYTYIACLVFVYELVRYMVKLGVSVMLLYYWT
jgi:hypothetical protein